MSVFAYKKRDNRVISQVISQKSKIFIIILPQMKFL